MKCCRRRHKTTIIECVAMSVETTTEIVIFFFPFSLFFFLFFFSFFNSRCFSFFGLPEFHRHSEMRKATKRKQIELMGFHLSSFQNFSFFFRIFATDLVALCWCCMWNADPKKKNRENQQIFRPAWRRESNEKRCGCRWRSWLPRMTHFPLHRIYLPPLLRSIHKHYFLENITIARVCLAVPEYWRPNENERDESETGK